MDARQSRVFATPCKFGYSLWSAARNLLQRARITVSPRVFDEVRTVDVGIFLREFRFGALILVVMTMTAPAALLYRGQQYSLDG